mmetsp:Transcript_5657/g.14368  ORF Transcript_5657/g.14368 Transcript_5657/m.14368 type:complete len:135 (-) Transcript_5657:815-1219(-)
MIDWFPAVSNVLVPVRRSPSLVQLTSFLVLIHFRFVRSFAHSFYFTILFFQHTTLARAAAMANMAAALGWTQSVMNQWVSFLLLLVWRNDNARSTMAAGASCQIKLVVLCRVSLSSEVVVAVVVVVVCRIFCNK